MAAPIKMDELLVSWLGSDEVYENVSSLIEKYREQQRQRKNQSDSLSPPGSPKQQEEMIEAGSAAPASPRGVVIPPFYPLRTPTGNTIQRRRQLPRQSETWDPLPAKESSSESKTDPALQDEQGDQAGALCVRDQVLNMLQELDISASHGNVVSFSLDSFVRITKEVCHFPSFFNAPLYERILELWSCQHPSKTSPNVTLPILEWFWKTEMEPFDPPERFFRLVKQPDQDCILKDDFLPYIKALLNDHPVSIPSIHSFFVSFFCSRTCMVLSTPTLILFRVSNFCPIMQNFKKSMPLL
jgi:hypothetical protein